MIELTTSISLKASTNETENATAKKSSTAGIDADEGNTLLNPERKPITVVSTSRNCVENKPFFILCKRWITHDNNFPMSNFDNFIDNMQDA